MVIFRVVKVNHLLSDPDFHVADIDHSGRYIEETIIHDHTKFKPVLHFNPYLKDFKRHIQGCG